MVIFITTILFSANSVLADINKQLTYYGILKTSGGANVSDGNYDMVFKIYSVVIGGTALWTGTYTAANDNPISVVNSNFSVLLGSGTGNTMTLDFNDDTYYIGITVSTDSEMTPRHRMGAAGYAFNADTIDGLDSSSFIQGDISSLLAGHILIYDGIDSWDNKAISGDATISSNGILTISDNVLDFTKLNDSLTLDTATTIGLNNNNFIFNLDGTGSLIIQDSGSAFATFQNNGDIFLSNNLFVGSGTETIDNINFSLDGDDLFSLGDVGIEGAIYTDSSFIAGLSLSLSDSGIIDSNGDLNFTSTTDGFNFIFTDNNSGDDFIIDNDVLVIESDKDRVGIGTTDPADKLFIFDTDDKQSGLTIDTQGTSSSQSAMVSFITKGDGTKSFSNEETKAWSITARGDAYSNSDKQNDLLLRFNNLGTSSTIMFFEHDTDNIGIGTTNPAVRLEIQNNDIDGNLFRLDDIDGQCSHNPESGSEIVSCSSDIRFKTDIKDAESVLGDLMKLRIRDYKVKISGTETTGVIAQEVQENFPEMISADEEGYLMVSQVNPWKLIKAIQEQQEQIEELQSFLQLNPDQNGFSKNIIVESSISPEPSFIQKIKQGLVSFGLSIKKGIAQVREVITEKIIAKFAKIETVEVQRFQMIDQITNEVYCIWIEQGDFKKEKAECDRIEYLNIQSIIDEDEVVEHCDSKYLNLCSTQELCKEANLYWYSEQCNLEQELNSDIEGCIEPEAENYNPEATLDNGTCEYLNDFEESDISEDFESPDILDNFDDFENLETGGCLDSNVLNYNPDVTVDDGSCQYSEPVEFEPELELNLESEIESTFESIPESALEPTIQE